jgi:divalent metal cation (Fe/Co/Zn/Cd) transporter
VVIDVCTSAAIDARIPAAVGVFAAAALILVVIAAIHLTTAVVAVIVAICVIVAFVYIGWRRAVIIYGSLPPLRVSRRRVRTRTVASDADADGEPRLGKHRASGDQRHCQ